MYLRLNPISWILRLLATPVAKRDRSAAAFTTAEHNRPYGMRCYKRYARGRVNTAAYSRERARARCVRAGVHVRAIWILFLSLTRHIK